MNTPTPLELEVLPPEVRSASDELSAPADKALAIFSPFKAPFEAAAALLLKESAATDAPTARRLRLDMVKARTAIDAVKKAAKADVLMVGSLIDWYRNKGVAQLEQSEARLADIEKAEERRIAAEKKALSETRSSELRAVGVDPQFYPVGDMPSEAYAQLLASSKLAHETKLAAAAKAEADRIEAARVAEDARLAKEKADAEAREVERLKAIELATENARLAKEKADADAANQKRIDDIEAKAKAERDAAAEVARKEAARLALVQQRRATPPAIEPPEPLAPPDDPTPEPLTPRQAQVYAARLAKIASDEKAKADKLAADAQAEAKALKDAADARIAADAKRQKDESDAQARAAAAPDKEKLAALAEKVKGIELPVMATDAGHLARDRIEIAIASLIDTIRAEYKALGKGGAK